MLTLQNNWFDQNCHRIKKRAIYKKNAQFKLAASTTKLMKRVRRHWTSNRLLIIRVWVNLIRFTLRQVLCVVVGSNRLIRWLINHIYGKTSKRRVKTNYLSAQSWTIRHHQFPPKCFSLRTIFEFHTATFSSVQRQINNRRSLIWFSNRKHPVSISHKSTIHDLWSTKVQNYESYHLPSTQS